MPKRLMIYAASVAPGGVETFTTQISTALEHSLPQSSWQLSILGHATNTVKKPIGWPQGVFKPLLEQESIESESAYSNADVREFKQLTAVGSQAFDVLYLPSPWGNIPLGSTLPIPAPVVMSLHDLEFEDTDYGIITDQHRREAQKFAKLGSAFVFSSEYVRERAIALYQFPRERTYVIHQAPTQYPTAATVDVRQKYGLPERFAFSLRWLSRRKNGDVLVEALGILKQKGLPSLPLVTAGYAYDDILPENIAHQRYQEQVQARIRDLGLSDVRDLGVVDQADIPALIKAATVVIAPSKSEAGLSYLMLDTMASGTPLIHARIPAVTERLGTNEEYALAFDPNNAEELAAKIADVAQNASSAKARAEKAKTLVGQRTQADVAREYFEIFKAVSECPWKTRPRQRDHVMRSREERVAWIINHTTLRDAELPIIRQFGLEVYTSKELPAGNEYRTASVDFSEDEHSTLPNWVLDRLNQHNFYENGLEGGIVELLNGYFGTVITSSFYPPIRDLVRYYNGRILVRVFGREHPHNYTEYLDYVSQGSLWKFVWENQHRFWFTPSYDSIAPIEAKLLRDRTSMLPLALPDRILRSSGQWIGNDKRILFICPRIGSVPQYYGAFYREFKEHLGHLPHLIGGHQPIPVDDPNVTGFVSDDVMQSWFRELRVMFYHSREPRHLHYHPLEAVAYGMPLIYLTEGLVEELMGKGKPGACATFEEAEQKLRRILDGDETFTRSVIESQTTLLDTFRPEYVADVWQDRFFNDIMSTSTVPDMIPFAKWTEPAPSVEAPARELQPNRRIGTYVLTVTGGGVYKYVTGVLHAAVQKAEAKNWQFDLIWGAPTTGRGSYSAPRWEYPAHPLLKTLPVRSLAAPERLLASIRQFQIPSPKSTWLYIKRVRPISRWRRSSLYLNHRYVRFATELGLIPLQYAVGMIQQRTLLPKNPRLRADMMTSRMGRRILSTRVVRRISKIDPASGQQIRPQDEVDYLKDLPEKPEKVLLPEISSPPFQPYLTLAEIDGLEQRYDAILFGNPFRIISPNLPIEGLTQKPIAITMYDLAHEFTEVWGDNAPAVSREMVLWGKLAQKIIFGSEYIRSEAVKRYGIPEANTQIVRPPPLVIRRNRPDADEIKRVKTKLKLPERYLFNTGFQGSHKNNINLFQAIAILRWRGFDVPPFVIGGVSASRLLSEEMDTAYFIALRKTISESQLEIGRDIIVVDFIEEDDLPAVYAGASIGISMSRSESTVHGMITESMLYGAPVIATTIPQNVEELGREDEFALLVPADDPVALADAIEYTLNNPEETAARIKRADTYINAKTWEKMGSEFLGIFEEIAASRPPKTVMPS